MPEEQKNYDARLSRVETNVENISSELRELTSVVRDYISGSRNVNWGWIIAGLGLFSGGILWVVSSQIVPLQSRVLGLESSERRLETLFYEHAVEQAKDEGRWEVIMSENSHELDLIWQQQFEEWRKNQDYRTRVDEIQRSYPYVYSD